jgi:hypothetical protein
MLPGLTLDFVLYFDILKKKNDVCFYLGNDLFDIEEGTPTQGDSSPSREDTISRVNPGNILNNRLSLEQKQSLESIQVMVINSCLYNIK